MSTHRYIERRHIAGVCKGVLQPSMAVVPSTPDLQQQFIPKARAVHHFHHIDQGSGVGDQTKDPKPPITMLDM